MITQHELEKAYSRIRSIARPTSLRKSNFLSELWQAEVFLKCEQFQPIGAFKIRGAANFTLQLPHGKKAPRLVTHSSGNHAQAVAYMAHKLGWSADIVMPKNSNKVKVDNATKWGATIHFCEPTIESRERLAASLVLELKAVSVPPYDHEWIVAGQATAAMECFREMRSVDVLLAPLGGGGLLSGSCLARSNFSPETTIFGAEPFNARDGYEGLKAGTRVTSHKPNTIADGLRTTVGAIPFEILKTELDHLWLAAEAQIKEWFYTILKEERMVIEPSSVVPIAAANNHAEQLKGKRVVVLISGGNVDFNDLP